MNQNIEIFPRENKDGNWILDYEFLKQIRKIAEENSSVDCDGVEAVLLAIEPYVKEIIKRVFQ